MTVVQMKRNRRLDDASCSCASRVDICCYPYIEPGMEFIYSVLVWAIVACNVVWSQEEECKSALGMRSGMIPDKNINASSSLSAKHRPAFARLSSGAQGVWCSAQEDSPYIQISFDEEKLITAVDTQGSIVDLLFAKRYDVIYLEGKNWISYNKTLMGKIKCSFCVQKNRLKPPIRTSSIRIYPKEPVSLSLPGFNAVLVPCLRLELYGCSAPAVQCPNIGSLDNAVITPVMLEYGGEVQIECQANYILVGASRIKCIGGQWNASLPSCQDIDECSASSPVCDANANCHNTVGSFTCSCKSGFTGDAKHCADYDECADNSHSCDVNAVCHNTVGSHTCTCKVGFKGDGKRCEFLPKSCSALKKYKPSLKSGRYVIAPDGKSGMSEFTVTCDMADKNGVGVTVISHDSEDRTLVDGYEAPGSYSRDVNYTGANHSQLASLTRVSSHCEQFIKYECHGASMFRHNWVWWMSRNSEKMTYWGGASPGSGKCACGRSPFTNFCANIKYGCNCDKNDAVWREDSGFLTNKSQLPVSQLKFGDTGGSNELGYHTLGKFKCYGTASK